MYKTPFLITGNFGNNAFSFEKRKNPTIYVPSFIKGTLDDAQIGEHTVFEDFDELWPEKCISSFAKGNLDAVAIPQTAGLR